MLFHQNISISKWAPKQNAYFISVIYCGTYDFYCKGTNMLWRRWSQNSHRSSHYFHYVSNTRITVYSATNTFQLEMSQTALWNAHLICLLYLILIFKYRNTADFDASYCWRGFEGRIIILLLLVCKYLISIIGACFRNIYDDTLFRGLYFNHFVAIDHF